MKRIIGLIVTVMLLTGVLTGCSGIAEPDDYVTNDGYILLANDATDAAGVSGAEPDTAKGISKENIKVGVLYISDPSEGSG